MAPTVEPSGERTASECDCRDLLQNLESILRYALNPTAKKAMAELIANDFNGLLSPREVLESARQSTLLPATQDTTDKSDPLTVLVAEERLPLALIKVVVLMGVIAILLIFTCRMLVQFAIRTYHVKD